MSHPLSTFTVELGEKICGLISEGKTLAEISRMKGMPPRRTVYDWLRNYPEFAAAMDIARDVGADAIAEEALRIADTPIIGEREEKSEDGYKIVKDDMLGHRKLQVETRLKLLAKWHPKRYGDKVVAEHTGAEGGPIKTESIVNVEAGEAYLRMLNGRS